MTEKSKEEPSGSEAILSDTITVEVNMGGVVERTLGTGRANANPDGLWVIMRLILVDQL